MTHPIAPLLKRFFSHDLPVRKGRSPHTLLAYRDAIKLLLCHVAALRSKSVDSLTVEAIDEKTVLNFLDSVETDRACTVRTRNARLAAIRSLFGFIAREEPELTLQCRQIREIPLKRTPHRPIEYWDAHEMQAVFDAVDLSAPMGIRDRALLLLLYNTGARVSEVVHLQIGDLRLADAPQITLHGKGNKDRSCPLWPETAAALNAYIKTRRPRTPDIPEVFLNSHGRPITRFGVGHVTRQYGKRIQPKHPAVQSKPLNPHRIRHTTAMQLLHAGNDINMIAYWLGHADINTTHVYVQIDMDTKRKMLETTSAPTMVAQAPWRRPDVLQWLGQLTKEPELCAALRGNGFANA